MRKVKFLIVIILILSQNSCHNQYQVNENPQTEIGFKQIAPLFPSQIGYLNDFDEVFSISQKIELSETLTEYKEFTKREIVVVTLKGPDPFDNIQEYATYLGEFWEIGKENQNNGLVIVLNRREKLVGIATGYGTEKILSDSICKTIIENIMIPEFKLTNYYSGIKKGVSELIKAWN